MPAMVTSPLRRGSKTANWGPKARRSSSISQSHDDHRRRRISSARSLAAPDERRCMVLRGVANRPDTAVAGTAAGTEKKTSSSTTASSVRGWSEQPHSDMDSNGDAVPVEERLDGAERGLKVSSVKDRTLETADDVVDGLKAVLSRRRLLVRSAEGVKAGKRELRIVGGVCVAILAVEEGEGREVVVLFVESRVVVVTKVVQNDDEASLFAASVECVQGENCWIELILLCVAGEFFLISNFCFL